MAKTTWKFFGLNLNKSDFKFEDDNIKGTPIIMG